MLRLFLYPAKWVGISVHWIDLLWFLGRLWECLDMIFLFHFVWRLFCATGQPQHDHWCFSGGDACVREVRRQPNGFNNNRPPNAIQQIEA